MQFELAVRYASKPVSGYRYSLYVEAADGPWRFAVPIGSDAYGHLVTKHLTEPDWKAWDRASVLCGSIQHIQTIYVDEEDLVHLKPFKIEPVSDEESVV